jgi:SAM-dependent methyltransferase
VNDTSMTSDRQLREQQYAAPDNLTARVSLWAYHDGPSVTDIALDVLALSGAETVLDVGCGYGRFLAALRERGHRGTLLGLDASAGMVAAAARTGAEVVVGDATRLPYPDASVDVAVAMHMLYHVPDVPAAVRELRRVLRPGGTLLATTNGAYHTAEIQIVMNAALRAVVGRERSFGPLSFTLENGAAILGTQFTRVERQDQTAVVDVPAAEPVLAYIASFGPALAGVSEQEWPRFLEVAERLVREHIAQFGTFAVTGHPGMFRCS